MDATLILTVVGTAIAIIGVNIGLMSWLRSDMKAFENKIEANMKAFENKTEANMKSFEDKSESNLKAFENKIESWKNELYKEMRDFHGKLCTLDERTYKAPKTDP